MKNIFFAIAVLLVAASTTAQIPTCPIGLPFGEFNRKSPFGDKICPALSNINTAINGLGSDINRKVNEVKSNMEAFAKNTMDGVVDEEAIQKFNAALAGVGDVKDDILNMVKDAECGVPGAFKALQTSFIRAGEDFTKVAGIALKLGQSFSKLQPLIPETVKILQEIKSIIASVDSQTLEFKKQLLVLNKAIEEIRNNLVDISKLDVSAAITSGQNLVTGMVPYLTSCAGCATSLAEAMNGLITAATGTGGGTAASETGVGAVIGAVVAALGGSKTVIATLASTPACAYMTANFGKVAGYVSDINVFIETASKLVIALSANANEVVKSSNALIEMGKLLSKENEPAIQNINTSLGIIAKAINNTANEIDETVIPVLSNFAGDKLKQVTGDVKQLKYCYDKMMETAKLASTDIIDNLKEMGTAATAVADVKKVIENLQAELTKANTEAQREVRALWNDMIRSKDRLVTRLLGSKPNDLGAIAFHLPTLADKIGSITNDASALASQVANLITNSVNEGRKAFQNRITELTNTAKAKYKFIADNRLPFLKSIAFAKAKINMEQKVRENAAKTAVDEMKTFFVKLPSLKLAVSLTVN